MFLTPNHMAFGRIVIGGPSSSGKSAFAIIIQRCLNQVGTHTFHRDYDPFSPTRDYILKKISNEERINLKKPNSEEDIIKRAKEFRALGSGYDLIIGDLPGRTDKTTVILASSATHAIILCSNKKLNEKNNWIELFKKIKIPIICMLESNQNSIDEICDGELIIGKLSNLNRDNVPPPPYSDSMIKLATAIGKKFQ